MGRIRFGQGEAPPASYVKMVEPVIVEATPEVVDMAVKLEDLRHSYDLSLNKVKDVFEEKMTYLSILDQKVTEIEQAMPSQDDLDKAVLRANNMFNIVEQKLNWFGSRLQAFDEKPKEKQEVIVKSETIKEVRIEEKMPLWAKVGLILQVIVIVAVILLK